MAFLNKKIFLLSENEVFASYENLFRDLEKPDFHHDSKVYSDIIKSLKALGFNRQILVESIQNTTKLTDPKLQIKTSGTTSSAKTVRIGRNILMRNVIVSPAHRNDIWGLTYPLNRFAGLQVLLQAVCNLNTIVNLNPENPIAIGDEILSQKITHLSGTPTFYRLLLRNEVTFPVVRQITSGGEHLDKSTIKLLRKHFPNSKIRNIYGSTEAGTLLTSANDEFSIPEYLKGKVTVRNGQLLIHHSLLADFDTKLEDGFYFTGDLVTIISESPLRFTIDSRNSSFIGVAGYRVDPVKVEKAIVQISGIAEARVYGLQNPVTGHLIACDILTKANREIAIDTIRTNLESKLLSYEIPRIINCVGNIKQTETGKKARH